MTSIQGTADVAVFIRRQLETLRASPVPRAKAPGQGDAVAGARANDLPSLVFRRIKFIDPADPDRRRKVFGVFLESVLLFELGDELMNDPKFYELAAQVQARMAEDADMVKSMDAAADQLISMAHAGG